MSIESVNMQSNIIARKAAEEVIALAVSMNEAQYGRFWSILAAEALARSEKTLPGRPALSQIMPVIPMDDEGCRVFEQATFPAVFKKHVGEKIGYVAEYDPGYLLWLADAKDVQAEFKVKLRQYLANPTIAGDVDRMGSYDGTEWDDEEE